MWVQMYIDNATHATFPDDLDPHLPLPLYKEDSMPQAFASAGDKSLKIIQEVRLSRECRPLHPLLIMNCPPNTASSWY